MGQVARDWVFRTSSAPTAAILLVSIALADLCPDGGEAFGTVGRLMSMTRLSRQSVVSATTWCVASGEWTQRTGPNRMNIFKPTFKAATKKEKRRRTMPRPTAVDPPFETAPVWAAVMPDAEPVKLLTDKSREDGAFAALTAGPAATPKKTVVPRRPAAKSPSTAKPKLNATADKYAVTDSIVKPWWEAQQQKPANGFLGVRAAVYKVLQQGGIWTPENLRVCLDDHNRSGYAPSANSIQAAAVRLGLLGQQRLTGQSEPTISGYQDHGDDDFFRQTSSAAEKPSRPRPGPNNT